VHKGTIISRPSSLENTSKSPGVKESPAENETIISVNHSRQKVEVSLSFQGNPQYGWWRTQAVIPGAISSSFDGFDFGARTSRIPTVSTDNITDLKL